MRGPGANTTRVKRETVVDATPEEVWETLTAGPLAQWVGDVMDVESLEGGGVRIHSERETRIELSIEPVRAIEATSIGGPSESSLNLAWHRRLAGLRQGFSRAEAA